MSSRKTKGKTTKKRAQRATSNVFAMFDQAQIQEFKEAFNMIDQNRDGFIDKEDLHDMLASLGEFCTLMSNMEYMGVPYVCWASCLHNTCNAIGGKCPNFNHKLLTCHNRATLTDTHNMGTWLESYCSQLEDCQGSNQISSCFH